MPTSIEEGDQNLGGGAGEGGATTSGSASLMALLDKLSHSGDTGSDASRLPIVIRKRGLPAVPGVTPGRPGRSDTVPAMLTPGEIVMNRGVTDNPQLAHKLLELNKRGAANMMGGNGPVGMEHGGQVPGYFMGGLIGMGAKALRGRLGKGQQQGPQQQGSGALDAVRGFMRSRGMQGALGGAANAFKQRFGPGGTFGGGMQSNLLPGGNFGGGGFGGFGGGGMGFQNTPQMPVGGPGFEHGGVVPDDEDEASSGRPSRALRILQLLLELDDNGGEEPQGFFFGGRAKKKTIIDPYGYERQQVGDIGAARQAGYFDPRGNQMMMGAMNEAAQGNADALVRRQMTQANLGGLDPAQRAAAKQQALMQTGRGVQDIMAQTRATGLQNQNQFFQNMYGQAAGAGMQARFQNDLAKRENERKGGFWGNLAGQAIGGFVGGLGGK